MAYRKHSIEELANALRATKGMVSVAARNVGMTRTGLYMRIQQSEALQQVISDEREAMTDTAELALHRAIVGGEAWAVCFYLKTQGKSRGYVERQEISGIDGGAIATNIYIQAVDYRTATRGLAPPDEAGPVGYLPAPSENQSAGHGTALG